MKIKNKDFSAKTYVSPDLESVFRELPIVQTIFALDDDMLSLTGSTYCYSTDNNIVFTDNFALESLPSGKIEKYDTLEFVKKFVVGKSRSNCFRLSTLMLHYYHSNAESKKIVWQDEFFKKYGQEPPIYNRPKIIDKFNYIVKNHDDHNNRYLIAHFSKIHGINEYLIRDMIFRKFLVADNKRNACFPIYEDISNKNHVVGMHLKSTGYKNNFTDYKPSTDNLPYLYTSEKHVNNKAFTYLQIFQTPLELMKYTSFLKDKIIKFPSGSSHLFAVLHTPDQTVLENLCKQYHFDNISCEGASLPYIKIIDTIKNSAVAKSVIPADVAIDEEELPF